MEISKKTDYALRMLSSLVVDPKGVVSVRSAARDNDVPYSFARSIQHDLAVAGIVENDRGAHGGMRLSVDPATTTLLDLVEAVQGPIVIADCRHRTDGASGPCPRVNQCHYSSVWCGAEALLREYLSSVTLQQLVVEDKAPQLTGSFELADGRVVLERALGALPDLP